MLKWTLICSLCPLAINVDVQTDEFGLHYQGKHPSSLRPNLPSPSHLHQLADQHQLKCIFRCQFSGNKPPITVANKGVWMWQERDRATQFFGVTLNPTAEFPINTMNLQSFLSALSTYPPSTRAIFERAIETCFAAIWHHDYPCATREDLDSIFAKEDYFGLGKDKISQVLDQALTKEARTKLQEEAKELVEKKGMFGAPSFDVERGRDGEKVMWFGSDRFEQLAAWLDVPYKGPFADGTVAKL